MLVSLARSAAVAAHRASALSGSLPRVTCLSLPRLAQQQFRLAGSFKHREQASAGTFEFDATSENEIAFALSKYPDTLQGKQSGIMPLLWIVQQQLDRAHDTIKASSAEGAIDFPRSQGYTLPPHPTPPPPRRRVGERGESFVEERVSEKRVFENRAPPPPPLTSHTPNTPHPSHPSHHTQPSRPSHHTQTTQPTQPTLHTPHTPHTPHTHPAHPTPHTPHAPHSLQVAAVGFPSPRCTLSLSD